MGKESRGSGALLPEAERMHREGMTWRQIAQHLKISYSALQVWRKLEETKNQGTCDER